MPVPTTSHLTANKQNTSIKSYVYIEIRMWQHVRHGARKGALAMTAVMTDKTDKIEIPRTPKALPLPRRPSYERTVEDIEKWANSSGLRKPARQ